MIDLRRTLLWNAHLQLVLAWVIVVLANVLAAEHFARLDVTRDRAHSLDEASKRIAGRLEKPLVVRAWFTRGLEAPYNNHERIFRDKLEEFRAYAGGRMRIEIVDPESSPEALKEAQKYGIQPLDYTVRQADRAELRRVWMGAALLYGDQQVVLPSLSDLSSLEYDLASAIHRLERKAEDRPVIGISTGHSEPDLSKPEGPLRTLVEGMAKKALLVAVPLGGPGRVPEEVDALLIIGPQRALSDRALFQVDQFVMRGGALAAFLMNVRPDLKTYRPQGVVSGLEPLLGHWGVRVGRDVVVDRASNGSMRFPVRAGGASGMREISYPLIPRMTDLSPGSVLTAGLDQMLFPFTSTVGLAEELPPGVRGEVLARTTGAAGAVQGLKTVDPTLLGEVFPGEQRGPFPVLVSVTGALRSFYETRPVPPPEEGAPAAQDPPEEAPLVVEGAQTRIVVSGSADMVANNLPFMFNLSDWLVQDTELIGIRSRIAEVSPLRVTTGPERLGWKLFNLLGGPLVLVGWGVLRYWRRK